MRKSLRWLTLLAAYSMSCAAAVPPAAPPTRTISPGPFQPTWASLQQYECPDWFRDAKFGIWAHWSAQCVPEQGDWYAQRMYRQGDKDYDYQVAHYGHPSKVGFKDIDHAWRAEHWEPEKLMELYINAGARYFVALANHHDNFDCWDSTYQPWNSVKVGPHQDIVGVWAEVARRHGLHFGVSVHAARAWDWLQVAFGSDQTGPLAGVPYDGNLTAAEGKGQWWEGLDPADLYVRKHGKGEKRDPAYLDKFFNRIKELEDRYQPDLLYFDDRELPLGEVGLNLAANLYNASAARHGGKVNAVINGKYLPPNKAHGLIEDFERGYGDEMKAVPWQTCTCIGDWHYQRGIKYKTVAQVVHTLIDVVSKNGNLLLSVPLRGDGTVDNDELKFLVGMQQWMKVNGPAIFGTRPWKIYGEGPTHTGGARFNEAKIVFGPKDIRFTTKDDQLFVFALGWPADDRLDIATLADRGPASLLTSAVKKIRLLGAAEPVKWTRDAQGLHVVLPTERPSEYALALQIEMSSLGS
jgi:alpha-L-fucosidase